MSATGVAAPYRLWRPAKRAVDDAPDYFVFAGDTYLTRGEALTGAADSRGGAFVLKAEPPWVRDGVVHEYWCSANGRVRLFRDTGNRIAVMLTDGARTFRFRTQSTFKTGDAEAVFLVAFDVGLPAGARIGRIYKNGALDTEVAADVGPPFDAGFAEPGWTFGSTTSGGNRLTAMISVFMMFASEFVDWSVPATMQSIYRDGALIEPGDHGEKITGKPPLVYCTIRAGEPATAFLANRGTGGDFAVKAGAAVKRSRAQLDYGDSFTAGALATGLPFTSAAFLQSRLYSPPRYSYNRGIGGQPLANPGSGASIAGRFLTDLPNNIAIYTDRIWRLQGGYNDRLVTLSYIVKAAQSMKDALLAADPHAKYYFIGVCNGGQRKGAHDVEPDEEYRNGQIYRKIIDINGGLAAVFGAHFYDVRSDLIAHGVNWASAGGFTLATPDEDAFDIAHDVVPTSLRAVQLVGGFPDRRYGIHLNNAGHYAHAVGEQIFRTGLGYD